MQLTKTRVFSFVTAAALLFATACGGGDDKNVLEGAGNSSDNPQAVATALSNAAQNQPTATSGGSTSPTRTPTSTSGSSGSGSTATLSGDAGDVQKAMINLSTQKSFRANIAADAGAQGKIEIAMEVVLPDKVHVTLKNAPAGLPAMFSGAELISLGSDVYIKTAGKWTKESTDSLGLGSVTPTDLTDFTSEFQDMQGTTVTKGSTDTVNGKRCQVYAIKDTADPSATGDVCIADNLPQRLRVNFEGGSATITFTDFGSNININKPI